MNSEKLASTAAKEKGLLDSLIANSRLYSSSKAYKELLDFVVRLRGFAPFNAMLLHIQKPGLTYAASARDWRERFKRTIKNDSRPLLILWPFSPIALVYDVQDTEGEKIPDRAFGFTATGGVNDFAISSIYKTLRSLGISVDEFDAGANRAGVIRLIEEAREKRPRKYAISLNRNYAPAAKFATLVHEMGHLWLGHLGSDERLKILDRSDLQKPQMEIEAESVAYILCHRNGVDVKSDQYLSGYIDGKESFCDLEIHRILQVAGQIESRLELAERISWDLGHSTGRDDGQPPNLGVTSSIPNSIQSSALPLQLQPPPLPQPTPLDASSLVDASIQLARAIQLFVRTLLKSVYSWLKRHKTCSW